MLCGPTGTRWRSGSHESKFFFFQAEDGIRDVAVTGVQMCALPISSQASNCEASSRPKRSAISGCCSTSAHCKYSLEWSPLVRRKWPCRYAPVSRKVCMISSGTKSTITTERSEEHTSELQSRLHLVCRLLL